MSLNDDLQAFYTFNETWSDSSTNSNIITPSGAIFDTSVKRVGSASGKSDGIDDRGRITNHTSIDITGDFSISLWLYLNGWKSFPSVFMKAKTGTDEGAAKVQYGMFINSNNVAGKLWGVVGNGTTQGLPMTDANLALATWYHIVMVRNGSTITLYLDTVAQTATGTLTGNLFTNNFDMDIFHDIRYANNQRVVQANIDAFGIWDRAITTDEISDLYNSGDGIELPVAVGPAPNPTVPKRIGITNIPTRVNVPNIPTRIAVPNIPKRIKNNS